MAKVETIFIDNSKKVLSELDKTVEFAMKVVGEAMEGYSKGACPVDTGRLRNSITIATSEYHSPPNTNKHPNGQEDAKAEDYELRNKPDKGEVWIGTNVEYAARQEYGDFDHTVGQAHFLQEAGITSHF